MQWKQWNQSKMNWLFWQYGTTEVIRIQKIIGMNLKSKIHPLCNLYLSSVSKLPLLCERLHCPLSIFHISYLYFPLFKVAWCSPILSAQKEWRKYWKITGGLCQVICVSIPFWYIQTFIVVGSAQGQNRNCPTRSHPNSAWYNNSLWNMLSFRFYRRWFPRTLQ